MDRQNPDFPQHPYRPPLNGPLGRRPRAFPVTFVVQKDQNGATTDFRMYYADEWPEHRHKFEAAELARKQAENAVRAAREAELEAGRPLPEEIELDAEAALHDPTAPVDLPPDYSRHRRRCLVCAHPDRDAIEADFIRWHSPKRIAEDYDLPGRDSLYRHAHATRLFERRRDQTARVMENVLETAETCPIGQFDVITRAVRLYSRLDNNGRLSNPSQTVNLNVARFDAPPPAHDGVPEPETGSPRGHLIAASPEIDIMASPRRRR